jgi:transcriptional regulator with XRE-family HTH domain
MTDAAVLGELGRRLARHRLERNWTQAELAVEAGVGQATVQRAERGDSVQMTSMLKLLRTLGLLGGLDTAIPESIDLPIAQLEREQRQRRQRRQRASGTSRRAGGRDDPPAGEVDQPASGRGHSSGGGRGSSPAGGPARPLVGGRGRPPANGGHHPHAEPTDQPWTWGEEPGAAA